MKIQIVFKTLVILLLIYSLNRCTSVPKTYFKSDAYKSVIKLFPKYNNNNLLVYYFDGDCSLCLAKMKYILSTFSIDKDLTPIFITTTMNPDILKYNISQLKIHPDIYIDKNDSFKNILKFNEVVRLNNDNSFQSVDVK